MLTRRDLLVGGAAAVGAVVAASAIAQSSKVPAPLHRKVLHVIGHSHIDAAWLWPWRDASDTVLTTFRSALDRMRETPGFCYSQSSSAYYRWVQQADPPMFEEIQQRIQEGRWEVVGGWPVEADCNLPGAESFARHCLYGKSFCKRTMGVDVAIGFNPDSFGHAAGLPTILRAAGYRYYVFRRPGFEDQENFPLLFWWEGPDGSRVLASRIWRTKDFGGYEPLGGAKKSVEAARTGAFAPGVDHATVYLGVGDHGGAVTKEQIRETASLMAEGGPVEIRWSTLTQFFDAIVSSKAAENLPVVKGELQHNARGCYSANGDAKRNNRRAERSLSEAELIALVANHTVQASYPVVEFSEAWWKVAFNQFHDLLAGTALYSDYRDTRDGVGWACETAQVSKVALLEMMARRVDTSAVPEGAAFLFNPLPWKRRALVEFHADDDPTDTGKTSITHLVPRDGAASIIQWRPADAPTQFLPKLCAWVDLPPCGYRVFELAHGNPPKAAPFGNSSVVSETGFGVSSIKSRDGVELLAAPLGLVVVADTSDTWGHGSSKFRQEIGRPTLSASTTVEDGPITRVTRQVARWGTSEIFLDIAQFSGSDLVELRFVIDWREHEQILKLEVPARMLDATVHAKVPACVISRDTQGDEQPYQDWAAVQGRIRDVDYTLAILNDGTYSYDCLGGLFRTVLVRSSQYARLNPTPVRHLDTNAWQDQGRQERRFWLTGARGTYSALNLDRLAEECQTPVEYVMDSAHQGSAPRENSFLEVMPSSMWVLSVKRAEASSGAIIRLQERSGASCIATIKSSLLGLDHQVRFEPWQLKTLLVSTGPEGDVRVAEVSILEG